MKKLGLLGASLAITALTGCFGPKGGAGGDEAIELAKQQNICAISSKTMVMPDLPADSKAPTIGYDDKYKEWNNDYLLLTTKQKVMSKESGNTYDVDISWTYEQTNLVREKYTYDDTHEKIVFNYSATEEYDFSLTANLKSGEATGTATYKVHLSKNTLKFDEYKISELLAKNDAGDNFALVETTGESAGYYKSNNLPDTKKCFVQTYGRVVYFAPDGNWALIADGDDVLELFSGSTASNLKTSEFPAFQVGKTVKVLGAMTNYCGNAQMSFVKDIIGVEDSKAAASTGFRTLTKNDFAGKHLYEDRLASSLRTVTATYNGNYKQGTNTDMSKMTDARYTFEVKVDDEVLTIAYDYHISKEGNGDIFTSFKTKLQSLKVGDSLTIKGTLRFAGNDVDHYDSENLAKTSWSLVPYAADHLA